MTTADAYRLAMWAAEAIPGTLTGSLAGFSAAELHGACAAMVERLMQPDIGAGKDDAQRRAILIGMVRHWADNGCHVVHIDAVLEKAIAGAAADFKPEDAFDRCPYPSVMVTRETLGKPAGFIVVAGARGGVLADGDQFGVRSLADDDGDIYGALAALWDALTSEIVTESHDPPKKKLAKRIRASKAPGLKVSTLRIRVPELMRDVVKRDSTDGGGTHASPSLHLVRSHEHRYWVGSGDEKRLEGRKIAAYWRGGGTAAPRVTRAVGVK